MRTHLALACTALLGLSILSTSASAGLYVDELAKCLVASTTVEDRNSLVKWMFAAIAQHPEVKSISTLTPDEGEELLAGTARTFERLLTESCLPQAKAAVEYEGSATLPSSFKVLGEVAARGLFANPDVAAYTAGLAGYIDQEKINATLGIKPSP